MMPPQEHIPSRYAIIPYYAVAAFLFVVTTVLCINAAPVFTGHYFQPKLLAVTHLAVLGWATMIIFGATNQLAPVISEHKLFSEKIPIAVLALLVAGLCLLIPSFWFFSFTVFSYTGGILLLSGFILHTWNIFKTVQKGKESIANDFILIAHIWLLLTALIGLLLMVNLRYPFLPEEHLHYLKIHGTIGMAGWFIQLVIGVSSRLIPMFLLSRTEATRWLHVAYYFINIGLILFLVEGIVARSDWGKPLYFLVLAAGMLCYFVYVRNCYKSAMRKVMDNGMKQTLIALFLIIVPFALLIVQFLAGKSVAPNIIVAYGVSFFAGFISTMIMGQTFKTLPFIVWMHLTKPDQLPELLPKDLFKEKLVKWQMIIFLLGYLCLLTGILTKTVWANYTGAILMAIASVIYFWHVIFVIRKLVKYEH